MSVTVNQGGHHHTGSNDDNTHASFMRSLPIVGAVEDKVIEPVAQRISWFSPISSIFDLIVPIELTYSWYQHIGKFSEIVVAAELLHVYDVSFRLVCSSLVTLTKSSCCNFLLGIIYSMRILVYAKHDGAALRNLFTQRFAAISTMVSLLVSSQIAVMFSPSVPTQKARDALANLDWGSTAFWAGFFLAISIIFSITALLATLSAWAIFNAVGDANSHVILRSTMCQNAAALPVRLALISIYFFFIWVNLFWHVVANRWLGMFLSLFCLFHRRKLGVTSCRSSPHAAYDRSYRLKRRAIANEVSNQHI